MVWLFPRSLGNPITTGKCQITLLRWLTFLLGSLNLFISSNASTCFMMAFPTLGNSDHVDVSVSIKFLSNLHRDVLFREIVSDYSHADWDSVLSWEDIFKLSTSAVVS